jgi:superfamily II DNA/RNA helicase
LFSEPFRLLKWDKPTRIQAAVLPEAFAKRDVIALAETGSG